MTTEELAAALDDRAANCFLRTGDTPCPEHALMREAAARLREMEQAERERDNWKRLYEEESAEYAEVAGAGDVRAVQTVIGRLKRELAEAREEIARLQTDYSATRQRCDEQAEEIERLRAQLCSIAEVLDGAGVVADSLTDGVAQLLTAVEDAEQREAEQAHAIENYQRHARESAATIIEQAERIKGLEATIDRADEHTAMLLERLEGLEKALDDAANSLQAAGEHKAEITDSGPNPFYLEAATKARAALAAERPATVEK